MALDHVGCLQWALKNVIESQIRQCYAGQMAMQFTNYKHRWENNIGKNTGLDNFSSLCARAFLAALHFLIIKINEPTHNLLLKVMGSLMNFLFVGARMIFSPDDSDNVFWGADNSDHAHLLTWPGSGPASPVWMFGPFLVRTFLMLSTHAIFWSSEHRHHHHKLFIKVSLQTVIWVCHIPDMRIFKILSMRNIKYEYWIQDSPWNQLLFMIGTTIPASKFSIGWEAVQKKRYLYKCECI